MKRPQPTPKEQEEENELILRELVSGEDPELIYELTDTLGKGSHGVVFKAVNRLDGSLAAIKKMPCILQSDNFSSGRQEITILKELDSAYCVEYYNSYLKDGDLWIAMEYFEIGSLGDLIAIHKKGLNETQVQSIVSQVLLGLEYLHSHNLIHRDIKAGNILLNKKGQVKLADFGISTFLEAEQLCKMTQIGSPFWMSPELVMGQGYSFKTDIWSLGITVIEMAEFEHPFFQQNPLTAVFQIVSEKPPTFSNPNAWSPRLRDFLSACLTKEVGKRPTTKELLEHPFIVTEGTGALDLNDDERSSSGHQLESTNTSQQTKEDAMRAANLLLVHQYMTVSKAADPKMNKIFLPEDTTEAIVRVYLKDYSYKSVRVTTETTAQDVINTLRVKFGSSEYALYKFQNENEWLVDPSTKILDTMKRIDRDKSAPLFWIFKEMSDTETFETLTELMPRLTEGVSLQTNREATEEFMQVLLKPRLTLLTAILIVARNRKKWQKENLVRALIKLFGHAKQLVPLFERAGAVEIARTVSANNLFVEDSMTARLVSAYGKLAACSYLRVILVPTLKRLYPLPEALELDPSRAEEESIESNRKNLEILALIILDTIFDNISTLPLVFRRICAQLHEIVSSSFPARGASHLVLRSFLFVKFICPALVSPYAFGLMDTPPSPTTGRTLVLLSKIIAAIVTSTRFGHREPYMAPLNEFIQQQASSEDLQIFLEAILNVDGAPCPPSRRNKRATLEYALSLPSPRATVDQGSKMEMRLSFRRSKHIAPQRSLPPRPIDVQQEDGGQAAPNCSPHSPPCPLGSVQDGTPDNNSKIQLTEEEMEEALNVIYTFLESQENFREVGIAMNVLPSPPWDPSLEKSNGDKELKGKHLGLSFWKKSLRKSDH